MMSKKCPKCHNVVNKSDKFCPDCGAPLEKSASSFIPCKNCNHENPHNVKFCEKCGTPVGAVSAAPQSTNSTEDPPKIVSKGNYSGTMVNGKTSRGWKIFKTVISVIILIGIIAFIIWFNTDPDSKEKLGNILFGFVVMAIFGAVIWRKSRKGQILSTKERQANYNWDDDYDNDGIDDDND